MFNYSVINELITETVTAETALTPSSAVLVRAMFNTLSERFRWNNDGVSVTDSEWDDIEAKIATLYYELDIAQACPDGEGGSGMIIGSIFAAATTLTPAGCLVCDGAIYPVEDYPLLAAVIDPQYLGVIEEVPVIILPNIKGRVVAGAGVTLPQGTEFGSYTHTLTVAELPSHNHLQRYHSNPSGSQTGHIADVTSQSPVNEMVTTANTGGDTPFDISQPSIAFWYYIVAQ